jgi:hypothetical protein
MKGMAFSVSNNRIFGIVDAKKYSLECHQSELKSSLSPFDDFRSIE